ncbi:hypothetical protein [Nostoc sp. 'Peltigera malacea cyanobiont' DB3992]|uniref:hypothetical protein n=1 Tax=Nostoc sp. 'Peltigera malacea cyanobiont' DB3992 TaxID=1206980 RepID=UPI00211F2089|nr:hypothetical protein [Nostoc sp. 'Peltigera malacea cyanobiont' DB3992]
MKQKPDGKNGVLTTEYRNGSFFRGIVIEPVSGTSEPRYANGRLMFDVAIAPGKHGTLVSTLQP